VSLLVQAGAIAAGVAIHSISTSRIRQVLRRAPAATTA
jgi:hypothetical protein